MAKLTDSDPMPQGKFKGQPMEDVPYWHLFWLEQQPFCMSNVKEYINENRDVLLFEEKDNLRRRNNNSN